MEEDVRNINFEQSAHTVWLLMGREYRISRSIRLQWFFQHLNCIVSRKTDEDIVNSSEELEVLSVLPSLKKLPTSAQNYGPLMITPTTRLSFVGRQYRFVFCIDMSPSLATVDTESGNVLFDEMFMNLQNAFTGLVQPFCIPGSSLVLTPMLHVTVIAHTYVHVKDCQVLMQGYCVNEGNVKYFLCQLKRKIQILEKCIAEEIGNRNKKQLNGEMPGIKRSETSLFYIIRDGLFALQLLPDNASAAIVVVTDGVFQFENAHISDALLQQVRHLAAVCSFLQVGTGFHKSSVEFGYVPHCALMQFIATATSGAYLANCPPVGEIEDFEMNMYHRALFCWNFQRDIDRDKVDSYQDTTKTSLYLSSWADCSTCLTPTRKDVSVTLPPQPLQTTNYNESTLRTNIASVLTVRSREGYITDAVRITKGKMTDEKNKDIEVKLVLPWKEHVTIEYIAKASWPFDSSSNLTNVIVNVSGPYEFLVDITSTRPKNHKQLRKITLERFEQTMKSLEASDHLLEQLQCFPTYSAAAKIPETVAKGSPLFCVTPNSNIPVLTLQYGSTKTKKSSKSPESQFASYWKPVVTMDTRTWTKWFHCHRISILPEHDRPIPSKLMVPLSPDHYSSIHCRASLSALFCLLKEWCSFILLENHSYVRFMSRSPQERPNTFCLLRLNFKGLCIVLRLAFLGGTPGKERSMIVEDLKLQLAKLTAHLTKVVVRDESSESLLKSPVKESACIVFLTKQFERILVKYDAIPDEIRRDREKETTNENSTTKGLEQNNISQATGSVLFQYLFNQRWIWQMGPSANATLEEHSIAEILESIIMQRLHEGFHFCSYNRGIVTMVKEVQVMVDSSEDNFLNCSVIQYVIFPPHTQIVSKSLIHDDSIESDNIQEVEGPFQMVAEIWVEPQLGTMDVPNSPLDYIHGYEYNKIPEKIFSVDAGIVQEIGTYMLIHKACYDKSIFNEFPSADVVLPVIPSDIYQAASTVRIPFLFQILPLLKKSRLIVSMYPMMRHMKQENMPLNSSDQNDIFLIHLESTLKNMNDHKVCLHQSESENIYKFIKQRCAQNNMRVWNHEENAPVFKQHSEDVTIEFNCFMKSFGSLIVIMFSPASVHDLSLLLECPDSSLPDSFRDSTKSDDTFVRRTHMPFFIFECEFSRIKAIPSMIACFDQDVLQDYTQVLNESAVTPRHLNQKLPDDRSREIAMYCQALYDHYFWSLVSAVYHCLESGYTLDPEDVELSIELVCEESIHEIDITNFIRIICSHYRLNTFSNEIFVPEDIVFPEDNSSPYENKPLSRLKKRSSSGSSSMRSSKNSLKSKPKECENVALQEEIQSEFLKILEQNFVSVPNDPYHMFFSNSPSDHDGDSDIDDLHLSSARSSVSQTDTNCEDVESVSTSGPESDNQLDDVEMVGADHNSSNDVQRPMFLHLTCSCHYKSDIGNSIRPISVTTLPTCLGDILYKLDDSGRSIDPYNPSLSITLDLICLTQPTEPEEGPDWKTPKVILKRQNSTDSFYSTQSEESNRIKRQRFLSQVSQGESYIRSDVNPLEVLPIRQREAMEKTIKKIDWLLEDEIASALRNLGLVTEENLNKVAKHVESSKGFENCIFERRYFMFVTGIEKASNLCLPLFICELESARLDRYHLSRVGKYYCLVLNSHVDDESDVESIMIDEIKEKAKRVRKTYGHRRSQSDFTNNRKHTIDLINITEKINHTHRSQSLPILYPWMFDDSDVSSQLTIDVLEKNSNKSSTRSNSSLSMNNGNGRTYVQRANSYGAKDIKGKNVVSRRRYSMPNIHVSFSVDACSNSSEMDGKTEVDKTTTDVPGMLENGVYEQTDCEEDHLQPHPDFWLFSHISEESVDVYFHRRHADSIKNLTHHQTIYNRLLQVMDQICKIVNQRILLENLYSTNQCHNLLVAKDDEQVWDIADHQDRDILFINERESTSQPFGSVIHGEYKFQPGYFECEVVWQKPIPIHSRLAVSNMVGGISKGLGAVRNALLQFRVSNRQNLFVIKEHESKNVFYFRVTEGSKTEHGFSTIASPPIFDDDHLFAPVREDQPSRASSYSSLIHKTEDSRFNRFEFERQESCQSAGPFFSKHDEHAEVSSVHQPSQEVSSVHQPSQECVVLNIYGIREPGKEIKEDMVNMITKKLDVTILALINQSLERNPKCKLSPQDVEFIQPIGHLPSKIVRLCVSNYAARYLHATIFYLQQHLLQNYNSPRFTVSNEELHFKNYTIDKQSALSASPMASADLLLYNRAEPSGNGVGIVYLNLVDQDGNDTVVQPYYPCMIYDSTPLEEQKDVLRKLTKVKKMEDVLEEDTEMCRNILIELKIWERGNIMLETFEKELLKNLQFALCDVFLEYHLLCAPLCFIPKNLQSSVNSSRRESVVQHSSYSHVRHSTHSSCSSNATTPKLIKPHPPVKKFFSEPTTPNDLRSESPASKLADQTKDDLSLMSELPESYPNKSNVTTPSEATPADDVEKRKMAFRQSKREPSPVISKKKVSREESPLLRKRSSSSRTPSVHSESELQEKPPKTISMTELKQLKLTGGASYVLLTDAEVQESLTAVEGSFERKTSTWQEREIQRRLELDNQKERRKHEHGLLGELHSNYYECANELFDHVIKQGATSLRKQTGHVTHQYSVDAVMKEFIKEMKEKCPDITPKSYKRVERHVDGAVKIAYSRYEERSAVKSEQDGETSMDHFQNHAPSLIPTQHQKHIILGHNSHKWLLSMGTNEADLSDNEEGKTIIEEQSKQRFSPFLLSNLSGSSSERRKQHETQPPSCIVHSFVPRQKFFMAIFDNRKICLYTYNFPSDLLIDKQFNKLCAWHNVRSHLNACLFIQKLGLYHHKHFVRDCPGKENADVAHFSSSSTRSHVESLMKHVCPKSKEKNKADSDHLISGVKVPEFDDIFRDTCPSKTLHQSPYFSLRDLVKRQFYQYQNVRNIKLVAAHKEARLKEIYAGWKQEGAHVPVSEDRLNLLKKNSLFIHYCDAPIMFKINKEDSCEPEEFSNEVYGFDENDSGARLKGNDWYEELKWMLVQQYIQYLQTLGLCVVQVTSKSSAVHTSKPHHVGHKNRNASSRSSRISNRSSDGKDVVMPDDRPSCYYLQKTSVGGIILVEVHFKKDYLCYEMFSFDSSTIPGNHIHSKDHKYFKEDCNKFKDLTHLRSFSYDFHLRQLQDHLSGRRSVFHKGYPVHKLMEKIIQVYPQAPKFCRCILADGIVSVPCTPGINHQTLFTYLISNSPDYKLSKLSVSTTSMDEDGNPNDFILVFNFSAQKQPIQFPDVWRIRRDVTEYDGTATVHFDIATSPDVISLPFFLVLRNKKEFYPRPHMLSSVSSLKRRQRTHSGMEFAGGEAEVVKQKVRVRFSGPDESREQLSQVQSEGNLKRMPSWSQIEGKARLLSSRSAGSDTSLSSRSNRSPVKLNILSNSPDQQQGCGSPDSDVSANENTMRSTSASTQENFLLNEQKFLVDQIMDVRNKLCRKVAKCLSNCWRDLTWLSVLQDDVTSTTKKTKKKGYVTLQQDATNTIQKNISQWKLDNSLSLLPCQHSQNISFSSIKELVTIVTCYRLSDVDNRISDSYVFIKPVIQQQVLRTLQGKFGSMCRQFHSDDGDVTLFCILNPGNLDMLFLIEANESNNSMDFSIVYRRPPHSKSFECKEEGSLKPLEKTSRSHIEHVVTCLCFSLWQQMIPL